MYCKLISDARELTQSFIELIHRYNKSMNLVRIGITTKHLVSLLILLNLIFCVGAFSLSPVFTMRYVYRVTDSLRNFELDCDILDSILEKNGIDCDFLAQSDEKDDEWIVYMDERNDILEKTDSPLQALHGRNKYCLHFTPFLKAQPSLPARIPREDLDSRRHSFKDTDERNSTVVSEVREKTDEVKDTEFQMPPNSKNLTNNGNYEDFLLDSSLKFELMRKYQQKVETILQPNVKLIWSKSTGKMLKIEYSKDSSREEALKKLKCLLQNIHEDTTSLPSGIVSQAIKLADKETSNAIVSLDRFNQTLQIAAFDQETLRQVKKHFISLTCDNTILSNPHKISLLFAEKFPQEMQEKYPEILIENREKQIVIKGPALNIPEVEKEINKYLMSIQSTAVELPKYTSILLKNKPVKTYIVGKMKSKKCTATWEMQENDSVMVYYRQGDQLQIARDIFKSSIRALNFGTGDLSMDQKKQEKWRQFRQKVQKDNADLSHFDENNLIGVTVDNLEEKIKSEFKSSFPSNILLEKSISLEKTQADYINKKKMRDIRKFCREFGTENPVTISIHSDDQMFITASAENMDKALKFSKDVIKESKSVENKMGNHNTDEQKKNSSNGKELLKIYQSTYRKKNISIYQGDMTQLHVDAIVNAANKELQHFAGLSKAIIDAGGEKIQQESRKFLLSRNLNSIPTGDAILTTGGKLYCKHVIHAVGPSLEDADRNPYNVLSNAVEQSLKIANDKACVSIAFPAISTGEGSYPLSPAVNCIVSRVKKYIDENSTTSLRDISFVDINQSTTEEFQRQISDVFSSSVRNRKDFTKPLPAETLSVTIKKGLLEKTQADIIINSTGNDLDLMGPLSKAIFKAAGNKIKNEFINEGPLELNQVIRSKGYELHCNNVYHIRLPIQKGDVDKIIERYMNLCLESADKDNVSSIAFPSLGTGNLNYPPEIVAREMLRTAYYHLNKHSTSLKEIFIIIYPKDTDVFKAFTKAKDDVIPINGIDINIEGNTWFSFFESLV